MKIRTAAFLAAIILLRIILPSPALAAQDENVIRVGWYDVDGSGMDGASSHGYYSEYLQALSQHTGWTYEFVEGTWSECLDRLERGKIDLLGFVHMNDDQERRFGFPSLPMATTGGLLVTGSRSGLDDSALLTGDEISVGVVTGNAFNEDFEKYRTEKGFAVRYVEYSSFSDVSPALERGDIDAAVVAEEDKTATEYIIVKFASRNQYFATNANDADMLRQLNDAMVKVNTYYPYLNNDLYQKYFGVSTEGKPLFTAAEKEFIDNNKNILVLYDSGWPPIEYFDEDSGTYKGISPDLFALLSERCGINFVYEGSTSGDVLQSLMSGDQRNTLTTISYDYTWAENHGVYITQPFITSGIVKLGRNLDSSEPVVAINEKAYFTYLLRDELDGKKTVDFRKQSERLEAVRTGEADYTFVTEDQADYYRSIPKYADLKTERMVGYEQKVCISIEKNSDPELMSVISKSLASISHDEMTRIITRNTVNAYKPTFSDWLFKNRVIIIVVAVFVLASMSASIYVSYVRRKSLKNIKAAYRQKEEALLIAEKASEAKGSFMSRMSHEIRTPLNAIIGYNTIARNEMSTASTESERRQAEMRTMDCLAKSEIASKHLLTIINDVLDMSAIESGKINIAHDRFDFKGLITSLRSVFYSQAKEKEIDFDVVVSAAIEEWFVGDQMRTNQILTNLISNAIKFTPEGGRVRLEIKQLAETDESAVIRFEVTDTGIGMSKEYLSRIWTPFEQEDSSISRRFGGSGLGLSITKSLVDLMDGVISVESEQGAGSTFTVDLAYGKTSQPSRTEAYDFSAINALVVDDDANTCDYIRLLFARCGARCATVTSGFDALEAYEQSEKINDPFNLCLVDWRMPKMNGIETIQRIRALAGDHLPIIVITAYDYSDLAEKVNELGIHTFVSKPLFQSSLFDLLANISGGNPEKVIKQSEKYTFSGAHILLAEDNSMNMEISRKILETAGITVESAWNGQEAVDMFVASPAGEYGAVLMDVQMPVMNGHQATRAIRQSSHPDAASVPIIAMTADAFASDVSEALASGMNGHISKPIDLATLFDTLGKYLPH